MLETKIISSSMFIGLCVVLLSMIFSPHNVFAQETTTPSQKPSILPDNILYGLKIALENIQEAITFQDEKRAELMLKHAEERDHEAIELEKEGKTIPLDRLKEIQAQKLMKAEEIIKRLESKEKMRQENHDQQEIRKELQQASTDAERVKIQEEQKEKMRSENAKIYEPDLSGKPKLIEPSTIKRPEGALTIRPVEDIKEIDSEQTVLEKLRIRLENSFSTSEITEIRAKFAELRQEDDPEEKRMLADQLDQKVNNPMVNIACLGRVNTFSLSLSPDPVKELQEQCPILKAVSTDSLRAYSNSVQ